MIRPKVADGDRKKRSPALQEPIFGVFWGPNSATTQKVEKMVGYKIISSLLTRLTCPVYAFSRFKRTKSVHRNYYFLPLYIIIWIWLQPYCIYAYAYYRGRK